MRFPTLTALLLLVAGCSDAPQDPPLALSAAPLAARDAPPSKTLFVALTPEESGIAPTYTHRDDHPLAHLKNSGLHAGGIAVGDIDNDGAPDVFLASSPGNNRLYRQVAPLEFEDITPGSGLENDDAWSRGASLVDIDNDGDLDLYVANYGSPNDLYLNLGTNADGSVRFAERAARYGLAVHDASLMPAFCDYDRDGDLDLYLISGQFHWPDRSNLPKLAEMLDRDADGNPVLRAPYHQYFRITDALPDPDGGLMIKTDKTGRPDILLRNDGGTFTDVTSEAGMIPGHGRGLSTTWWDYNDDGLPDLYVANDWGDRDFLYHNNGDGTFHDAIEDAVPSTSMFSMGSDTGDLNNDGRIDCIVADMSGTTHYKRKISMGAMEASETAFMLAARPPQNMRNAVYLNTGTPRVFEAAYLCGLANSDWSWALRIADLDNDGRNDVFVTNGMEQNIRASEGSADDASSEDLRYENNLAFRNDGDLHFQETGTAWGLGQFGYSLAAAPCDFDRDGDLDLLVIHRDEPPTLYQNTGTSAGILVQLHGSASNRHGIGATLRAETPAGTIITRQIMPTRGYLTSDEPVAHFGLGAEKHISKLTIDWPSGHRQEVADLAAGQLYQITEPGGPPPAPAHTEPAAPLFATDDAFPTVTHAERPFDDFAAQPLLPNKLSQLGPGIAVGDIDGDGRDDIVLGGAAGSPTQVVSSTGDGTFGQPRPLPGTDGFEDMGILLFDADADGDRDLYAVSGGVEGSPLQDRFYRNDGTGQFTRSDTLPPNEDSGGPVAAADIDRDGDLDLFVGGRVLPGQYPLPAESRLLLNDGTGTFTNAPIPPALGLVTGATFADLDDDGWQDLLVAREWGAVAYLHNDGGTFTDRTADSGLAGLTGWWNGVATGDFDRDGDLDFVATNFGHNTKYHASPEHPALLYYGSFGTDTMRLVEAEFEGDHLLPVRGKSCSTRAIPHLADKFKTFHDFALAGMEEIYTQPIIDDSTKFAAATLDTGIFLNDGGGNFTFLPLPPLAQIAPGFGIVVSEFDGDGIPDLFLGQNFYTPQPETGRMSGGLGLVLRGNGDASFTPLWPHESGIRLPEDATGVCLSDAGGRAALVVATNDGPIRRFVATGRSGTRVTLRGTPGNPDGIGARLTATTADGTLQTVEIQAGHGYLGQSSPGATFGGALTGVTIRWPNGATTTETLDPGAPPTAISYSHP